MVVNSNPLVSIIVPCYNSEKYLPQMIDCLLNQTYSNYEAIFVDDGSTDHTPKIIEAILGDSRIKLIRQNNQYAGIARNMGMSVATGEYIIFLDSDDVFDRRLIEILLESIQIYDSDMAVCNINYIDEVSGEYLKHDVSLKRSILEKYERRGYFSSDDLPNEILTIGFSGPYNKMCKRSFLEKKGIKFQGTKRDNDLSFSLSVMAAASKISWVYDCLYTYRVNNPISLQGFNAKRIDIDDLISTVKNAKSELIRLGKYENVRYSFQKQVLGRWHFLLEQQNSFLNYKIVFDAIKSTIFDILEIKNDTEYNFVTLEKDYKKLVECDAEDFLFWKYKKNILYGEYDYLFPFEAIPDSTHKIVIYGYGNVGKQYVSQLKSSKKYELVAILDRAYKNIGTEDIKVDNPEIIGKLDYETVVVAVEDKGVASKIINWLSGLGVTNIVWKI